MRNDIVQAITSRSLTEIQSVLEAWTIDRLSAIGVHPLEDALVVITEQVKEAVLDVLWFHTGFVRIGELSFLRYLPIAECIDQLEHLLLSGPIAINLDTAFLERFTSLDEIRDMVWRLSLAAECSGARISIECPDAILARSPSYREGLDKLREFVAFGCCDVTISAPEIFEHFGLEEGLRAFLERCGSWSEGIKAVSRIVASGPWEVGVNGEFLAQSPSLREAVDAVTMVLQESKESGGCLALNRLDPWLTLFAAPQDITAAISEILNAGPLRCSLSPFFHRQFGDKDEALDAIQRLGEAAKTSPERSFPPTTDRLHLSQEKAMSEKKPVSETLAESFAMLCQNTRSRLHSKLQIEGIEEFLKRYDRDEAMQTAVKLAESGPIEIEIGKDFLSRCNDREDARLTAEKLAAVARDARGILRIDDVGSFLGRFDFQERPSILAGIHRAGVVETDLDQKVRERLVSGEQLIETLADTASGIDLWHRDLMRSRCEDAYSLAVDRLKEAGLWPEAGDKQVSTSG
jgi:hypothetical protein